MFFPLSQHQVRLPGGQNKPKLVMGSVLPAALAADIVSVRPARSVRNRWLQRRSSRAGRLRRIRALGLVDELGYDESNATPIRAQSGGLRRLPDPCVAVRGDPVEIGKWGDYTFSTPLCVCASRAALGTLNRVFGKVALLCRFERLGSTRR